MNGLGNTEDYAHGDHDQGCREVHQDQNAPDRMKLLSPHQGVYGPTTNDSGDINKDTFLTEKDPAKSLLPVTHEKDSTKKDATEATIFDLRITDRRRVGKMIQELASATERLEQLEFDFDILSQKEAKYKDKSNQLMKKVDALTEKCQKLEDEKTQMKEKHHESLNTLHSTVTNISHQFEISAKEMSLLSENNALLQTENNRLRGKLVAMESKMDIMEKTNRQISTSLAREKSKLSKSQHHYQKSSSKDHSFKESEKVQDSKIHDQHEDKLAPASTSNEEEILHALFFRF